MVRQKRVVMLDCPTKFDMFLVGWLFGELIMLAVYLVLA